MNSRKTEHLKTQERASQELDVETSKQIAYIQTHKHLEIYKIQPLILDAISAIPSTQPRNIPKLNAIHSAFNSNSHAHSEFAAMPLSLDLDLLSAQMKEMSFEYMFTTG